MKDEYQWSFDEAVKYLASHLGELKVRISDKYQIKCKDFELIPGYGLTFQQALVRILKCKFGNDLIAAAKNKMKESHVEIPESIQKEFDELKRLNK